MATVANLIRRAYILAKILDPNEETEGYMAEEGTDMMNEIISQWSSLQIYIPTYKEITITTVAGTYEYTVTPVIVEFNEANVLDSNNCQFPVNSIDLTRYNLINFELADTARSRPSELFIKNDFANYPTQSKVILFPIPDDVYTVTLYAKVRLASVSYSDTITTIPDYWLRGLRYELAYSLASEYGTDEKLSPAFYEKYSTLIRQLKAANQQDKSVKVFNPFNRWRRFKPWGRNVY